MRFLAIFIFLTIPIGDNKNIDSDTICWSEGRKLSWEDFRGKPDSLLTSIGYPAQAVVNSKVWLIPYKKDSVVRYRVKVTFESLKSWTKTSDDNVLNHEQTHFDISELFGRKIREYLTNLDYATTSTEVVYSEVKEFLNDLETYQGAYDRGTVNGAVAFRQEEWNERVGKELNELVMFTSTLEDCE